MKKLSLSLFLSLAFFTAHSQTEWAKEGTRWWHHTTDYVAYAMSEEFESKGQAMINGQLCQIIQSIEDTIYTYAEDDTVYYWDPIDSSFYIRYDWSKEDGEAYDCSHAGAMLQCTVISTDTKLLNGATYQTQYVEIKNMNAQDLTEWEEVVIGIGGSKGLYAPFPIALTPEVWTFLVCYDSEATGLLTIYDIATANCESLALPVFEPDLMEKKMIISPNPSPAQGTLEYKLPPSKKGRVHIFDSVGRQITTYEVTGSEGSLVLPEYPKGLYFAVFSVEGQVIAQGKFVRL